MQGFERKLPARPRVLLAYVDSIHAARSARHLRRQGWEVHLAASGAEVYRLVRDIEPGVVVLDTELHDESGWLISAKLSMELSSRIVLLAPDHDATPQCHLEQIGAASVVTRSQGIEALVKNIVGNRYAQAV